MVGYSVCPRSALASLADLSCVFALVVIINEDVNQAWNIGHWRG